MDQTKNFQGFLRVRYDLLTVSTRLQPYQRYLNRIFFPAHIDIFQFFWNLWPRFLWLFHRDGGLDKTQYILLTCYNLCKFYGMQSARCFSQWKILFLEKVLIDFRNKLIVFQWLDWGICVEDIQHKSFCYLFWFQPHWYFIRTNNPRRSISSFF